MAQKRYPFNAEKYAHDIEFRRNRAKNELSDKRFDNKLTAGEEARYNRLIDDLGDLLGTIMWTKDYRGIAWLTGKEYGLAKECVGWAAAMRE